MTGPHYDREARKMAFWYGIASLLFKALAVCYIFISGECLIIEKGVEGACACKCPRNSPARVSFRVGSVACMEYWEARSKKEQSLQFGCGSIS
ncbi:TPA: hypothetical protein N0F65_005134 [Lagenidium giganteum]|uniref:Uncharacterized protein n=1 Tax=Lagenidium giganteum TaxID=4803 RepID=A0AAV2YWC5_9STRA|nr:TPA: hypothetical protein N0F65_005134 [Lagenidium giganteum]